jgi:hypothetical protein
VKYGSEEEEEEEERWLNGRGGEVAQWFRRRGGSMVEEERWLNGSAPDCKSVVLGSNPAPPQHMANSVSPEVGSYLGWHSTVCWPLRGGRGTYTYAKTHKNIKEKKQSQKINLGSEMKRKN